MHIPRVYLSQPLKVNCDFFLENTTSKHLVQVLRLNIGSPLILFNNTEGEYYAQIKTINKNQTCVFIESFIPKNSESPLKIQLGQGISRGEKMDFTIQKAVELGVNSITPLFTEFCNVKLDPERLQNRMRHWQAIAISAAEQSGRTIVPQIFSAQKLETWITNQNGLCLVLDPEARFKLKDISEPRQTITLLVGPEGGLSASEIILATNYHFISSKLGPRILRTETAALAALSVIQARWGDF